MQILIGPSLHTQVGIGQALQLPLAANPIRFFPQNGFRAADEHSAVIRRSQIENRSHGLAALLLIRRADPLGQSFRRGAGSQRIAEHVPGGKADSLHKCQALREVLRSVSPGKPTMISVVRAISGAAVRIFSTRA